MNGHIETEAGVNLSVISIDEAIATKVRIKHSVNIKNHKPHYVKFFIILYAFVACVKKVKAL